MSDARRADGPGTAAPRLLVVQTGFLGDVVLTTPLLAALRRRFPAATLDALVTPAAAPLLAGHPVVDEVLTAEKRGREGGLLGPLRLGRRLRARRYDLAVAAHKSIRTALALWVAGIPRRIGFAGAPGAALYTERVPRPLALHDRDRLLGLLAPLTPAGAAPLPPDVIRPWVALDGAARMRAAELLAPLGAGPRAAICPGSVWATKRWPADGFAELVTRLEDAGYRCVLLGAPDERALTAAVRTAAGGRGLDLGGATDPATLAAVLAAADVVVSNDSAPMHLASAVGVPQVAIFCATVPAQGYGPVGARAVVVERDLACRPCGRHGGARCPRGTDDCMRLVEVDAVRAAVERARAA